MKPLSQKHDDPISVSQFIQEVNGSLAAHRSRIQGEITSLSLQYGSAIYFSIKDKSGNALLKCIMWKSTYMANGIELEVGDEIIVTGTPEVYAPQGSFTVKAQTIEYAGEGALKKSYEELKKKLEMEGLLLKSRKKVLPEFPKRIGVITSKAGVVIQDFTSNLGKYGYSVTVIDSRVEGKDAIHELLRALQTMKKQDIEVLVIMRGGGSWESLQPFNTESVVRAVTNFACPVLTGIGHDTDVTLVQMVADVGVSTPTAVAEALNSSWDKLISVFNGSSSKVLGAFQRDVLRVSRTINVHTTKTKTYFSYIEKTITRANMGFQKSVSVLKLNIHAKYNHIERVSQNLVGEMRRRKEDVKGEFMSKLTGLMMAQKKGVHRIGESIKNVEKYIKIADPKRNLELGYSLAYSSKKLIRSKADIKKGDMVDVYVSDGQFTSEVKSV